jgi:hypothetical protein
MCALVELLPHDVIERNVVTPPRTKPLRRDPLGIIIHPGVIWVMT